MEGVAVRVSVDDVYEGLQELVMIVARHQSGLFVDRIGQFSFGKVLSADDLNGIENVVFIVHVIISCVICGRSKRRQPRRWPGC